MKRVLIVALSIVAVVGIALALRGAGDSWFYYPGQEVHGSAEDYGLAGVEEIHFSAHDGPTLHGWWVPAQGEALGTVVYCHGNSQNLTLHSRYVAWLPRHGFQLLVFDYREYGQSRGSVTRDGTVEDALAAIDVALARDPFRTSVFGHSLGGAVAIAAAARRPQVRAVIAESTFPSYRAAARERVPSWLSRLIPWFVSEGLDPEDALAHIAPRPLLVIHGSDDDIVPLSLGRRLYEHAGEPKQSYFVTGADHFTPWVREPQQFEETVVSFLTEAVQDSGPE